ncbi:MAG: UDP-glucose--tetrahydrobiopterin glucosyltransferase [Terriglobia bacterium]|nr:MAG: UDP-glucose--tetrahydrobiopterin glucosyltransferase [Terriglobia bacterium]
MGSGDGGGVETTLHQIAPALMARGHKVAVVAPAGSSLPAGVSVYEADGTPPRSAAVSDRFGPAAGTSAGVLEQMWRQAAAVSRQYDIIVALTYDWLSYHLTPFLAAPVLHWISLPSCVDAVDRAIRHHYQTAPESFAFVSRAQAATFPFVDVARARIIPGAVDIHQFRFSSDPDRMLIWVARISPEKGLEDALRAAQMAGVPLHVCGKVQDSAYWEKTWRAAAPGELVYHGLLSHERLAALLGRAQAMLVTPKWVEAFGLVVLEALACGTPVIAYDRGGPPEILAGADCGFIVPPGDVGAMAAAISRIGEIRRADARRRAEVFSIEAMAVRVEGWIGTMLRQPRMDAAQAAAAIV